ncbi:TPA: flagellar protein FlhE [Salmonella enterica subsp. enterica serovar Muenchen]|nr:flagellar protein FlhE [Salmonella enterica]EJH1054356.1 flagellar protein FlhE [Salmonella enterica]HEC7758629.1 flagellar protein FlhE [Salmonella enterica subsp. enterica serovar Muenchen]HEC8860525.1 flagellar protein FlhE [Salmonella enterica subsp. enterica serovar Muenchen]
MLSASIPLTSYSSNGGSWSEQTVGGTISIGNQLLISRSIHSPANIPKPSYSRTISWKINLLSPPPSGLTIKLCSQDGCVSIPSLSGQIHPAVRIPAYGTFYFIYTVKHNGQLLPPLTIINNRLTINYN